MAKITYREHQLTECQKEGRRAFCERHRYTVTPVCPDYNGDKGKQAAWTQGYTIERNAAMQLQHYVLSL